MDVGTTGFPKRMGNPNWVKGRSGNPDGPGPRKNQFRFTELLRKRCELGADQFVDTLCELALNAENEIVRLQAIKYVIDRIDGKPREQVEVFTSETILDMLREAEVIGADYLRRSTEANDFDI